MRKTVNRTSGEKIRVNFFIYSYFLSFSLADKAFKMRQCSSPNNLWFCIYSKIKSNKDGNPQRQLCFSCGKYLGAKAPPRQLPLSTNEIKFLMAPEGIDKIQDQVRKSVHTLLSQSLSLQTAISSLCLSTAIHTLSPLYSVPDNNFILLDASLYQLFFLFDFIFFIKIKQIKILVVKESDRIVLSDILCTRSVN